MLGFLFSFLHYASVFNLCDKDAHMQSRPPGHEAGRAEKAVLVLYLLIVEIS